MPEGIREWLQNRNRIVDTLGSYNIGANADQRINDSFGGRISDYEQQREGLDDSRIGEYENRMRRLAPMDTSRQQHGGAAIAGNPFSIDTRGLFSGVARAVEGGVNRNRADQVYGNEEREQRNTDLIANLAKREEEKEGTGGIRSKIRQRRLKRAEGRRGRYDGFKEDHDQQLKNRAQKEEIDTKIEALKNQQEETRLQYQLARESGRDSLEIKALEHKLDGIDQQLRFTLDRQNAEMKARGVPEEKNIQAFEDSGRQFYNNLTRELQGLEEQYKNGEGYLDPDRIDRMNDLIRIKEDIHRSYSSSSTGGRVRSLSEEAGRWLASNTGDTEFDAPSTAAQINEISGFLEAMVGDRGITVQMNQQLLSLLERAGYSSTAAQNAIDGWQQQRYGSQGATGDDFYPFMPRRGSQPAAPDSTGTPAANSQNLFEQVINR